MGYVVWFAHDAYADMCEYGTMCLPSPLVFMVVFFQAEDGIRDLVRSRGLGDVYKRQGHQRKLGRRVVLEVTGSPGGAALRRHPVRSSDCLSLIHI